jgi:hypothetical protein
MIKTSSPKYHPLKCSSCGVDLTNFIAYLPNIGEVCFKCFAEYAQEEDNEIVMRNANKNGKHLNLPPYAHLS